MFLLVLVCGDTAEHGREGHEDEATGHVASAIREHRERWMLLLKWLPFYSVWDPSPWNGAPTFRVSLFSVKSESTLTATPRVMSRC